VGVSITVDLPDEVRSALDEVTRAEGVSADEIVGRALRSYLFVRRFRELRAETLVHMRETGQDDLTDEDVFRLVS
jgi:metal-responsive CopG/Arc/MetJ family transcriptional regulator